MALPSGSAEPCFVYFSYDKQTLDAATEQQTKEQGLDNDSGDDSEVNVWRRLFDGQRSLFRISLSRELREFWLYYLNYDVTMRVQYSRHSQSTSPQHWTQARVGVIVSAMFCSNVAELCAGTNRNITRLALVSWCESLLIQDDVDNIDVRQRVDDDVMETAQRDGDPAPNGKDSGDLQSVSLLNATLCGIIAFTFGAGYCDATLLGFRWTAFPSSQSNPFIDLSSNFVFIDIHCSVESLCITCSLCIRSKRHSRSQVKRRCWTMLKRNLLRSRWKCWWRKIFLIPPSTLTVRKAFENYHLYQEE